MMRVTTFHFTCYVSHLIMSVLDKVPSFIKEPNWKVYTLVILMFLCYIYFVRSDSSDNTESLSEINHKILREEARRCLYYHPRFVKDAYGKTVEYEFRTTPEYFYVLVRSKGSDNKYDPNYNILDVALERITWEELEKHNEND